jgi:ATP-grasp domain
MPRLTSAQSAAVIYPCHAGAGLGWELARRGSHPVAVVPEHAWAYGLDDLRLDAGTWDEVVIDRGDPQLLVARLRSLNVGAVLPGFETGVALSDRLAAALGLAGNDPATSADRTDKAAMMRALSRAALPHPHTIECRNVRSALAAAERIGWPVVLKPTRSAGSDGVAVCRTAAALSAAWQATYLKRNGLGRVNRALVVQQYISGDQLTVNTVSVPYRGRSRHSVADVWLERMPEVDGGHIVYGESYLLPLDDARAIDAAAYAFAALDAVGVVTGPAHSEIMLTGAGPLLIELGARLGGGYDAPLMELVAGWSQCGLAAAAATDPEAFAHRAQFRPASRVLAQVWLTAVTDGKLDGTVLDEIRSLPSVASSLGNLTAGAPVMRTIDMDTSPGLFNLSGRADDVARDIREVRKLEERLYLR